MPIPQQWRAFRKQLLDRQLEAGADDAPFGE
jgi:hypothetical protein